jgi:hypothetical protein
VKKTFETPLKEQRVSPRPAFLKAFVDASKKAYSPRELPLQ